MPQTEKPSAEIIACVKISEVYRALGGGELRHGRGIAFWRGGDGYNVSMDDSRGVWHDFASGDGGGVLDLVVQIRGGAREDALRFVADLAGVALDKGMQSVESARTYADAERVRRDAGFFADAARNMAEWALEVLQCADAERAVHTALLAALRVSPEAEYRAWVEHQPEWAAALVHAGRERKQRLRRMVLAYVKAEVAHGA